MYKTENRVTLELSADDHAQGVKVVYLIKALVLRVHLLIHAVNRFYSALKHEVDIVLTKARVDLTSDMLYEVEILTVSFLYIVLYLIVSDRVEIHKSKVLKLLLDPLHTEPVGKRCIDLHRLKGNSTSLRVGLCRESSHIVEPVA